MFLTRFPSVILKLTTSFCLSNAEVASSSISKKGFFNKAHARAIHYFSPPDNRDPEAPTFESIPLGSQFMIESQFAC